GTVAGYRAGGRTAHHVLRGDGGEGEGGGQVGRAGEGRGRDGRPPLDAEQAGEDGGAPGRSRVVEGVGGGRRDPAGDGEAAPGGGRGQPGGAVGPAVHLGGHERDLALVAEAGDVLVGDRHPQRPAQPDEVLHG